MSYLLRTKKSIFNIPAYVFLIALSIIVILPVIYAFAGSVKSTREILADGGILPKQVTFESYIHIFTKSHFERYALNSVIIAALDTIIGLFNISAVGFCFARVKFAGKKIWKGMILVLMFISLGPSTLKPTIEIINLFHLQKSIWGIAIAMVTSMGTGTLIFEAFYKSQGDQIDEAAIIDGCNLFKRYFFIGIPLSKPLLATFAITIFNGAWNSYLLPYVMTFNNIEAQPLAVAVYNLQNLGGEGSVAWGLVMAGATITMLPVIIVYLFTSKWLIRGIMEGAIKM